MKRYGEFFERMSDANRKGRGLRPLPLILKDFHIGKRCCGLIWCPHACKAFPFISTNNGKNVLTSSKIVLYTCKPTKGNDKNIYSSKSTIGEYKNKQIFFSPKTIYFWKNVHSNFALFLQLEYFFR